MAAFLTSGDLWISWVSGKDTFEELLLDYEPTVACGLWMRSSCSAFVHAPMPYYCPISFGQKLDPKGQYIRTFCPELRNVPSERVNVCVHVCEMFLLGEYIYCPWLAPLSVQRDASCMIGTDYPSPMVDHSTAGNTPTNCILNYSCCAQVLCVAKECAVF